jgi:hypothetical protein
MTTAFRRLKYTALCAMPLVSTFCCACCAVVALQLLRLLPLEPQLSDLLGQDASLAALLSAQPGLLNADPLSLQVNCQHLQELLGQQAAAAAAKCPQILSCSPYR